LVGNGNLKGLQKDLKNMHTCQPVRTEWFVQQCSVQLFKLPIKYLKCGIHFVASFYNLYLYNSLHLLYGKSLKSKIMLLSIGERLTYFYECRACVEMHVMHFTILTCFILK